MGREVKDNFLFSGLGNLGDGSIVSESERRERFVLESYRAPFSYSPLKMPTEELSRITKYFHQMGMQAKFLYFYYFLKDIFICFERERECVSSHKWGKGKTESQADILLSMEPILGLDLITQEIMS